MPTKKLISEVMKAMGRKGGKIGGKRSLETMTPDERSARAKKASDAAAKARTAKRLERERNRTASPSQISRPNSRTTSP